MVYRDSQVYGYAADIESEEGTKSLAKYVLDEVKDIHILVSCCCRSHRSSMSV